ncbi:MAG: hypothetical protein ACREE6_00870 [Limisphaerales bacterium]
MAQDVLSPPPAPPPIVPSSIETYQTNQAVQMRVFAPSAGGSPQETQPFKIGPVVIRPNVSYQFLYGNGIQSSPGNQQNSIVQEFIPALVFEEGLHWTLTYTPVFSFYSSSAFRNTINQNVQLQWGTTWRDWFLTASQGYAHTDDPQIETGGQTEQDTYSTALNGIYHFNDKLSMDSALNQTFNDFGSGPSTNLFLDLVNSRTWSTMDWLNDQFWPRCSAGLGVGLGYNQQQDSPNSTFQQYEAQMSWRLTDKISFQVNGGLEDQEYLSGGASALITPIFGGVIQYQPLEHTQISITANRTVGTSAFDNENVEATSIIGDFNQRLFGFITLDLNGGFSTDNYIATAAGFEANSRNDDIYSFSARLSCPFPKRGTVSIFYQYSETASSQSGFASGSSAFGYSSNQAGIDISYIY